MLISDQIVRRVLKPVAFLAALIPVCRLLWAFLTDHLGANPLGAITNTTGDWTLRFLCIALAVTPVRRITGWNGAIRFRRMLGLFAFFYGTLHFLTYIVFDRLAGVDVAGPNVSWMFVRTLAEAVADDIYKRPFIAIGFAAFVVMLPLAATSTTGMIRRLGGRRWRALHRLMYVACIGGAVHYWWLVKADVRRPLAYGTVVALLLAFRVYWARVAAAGEVSTKSSSPSRVLTIRSGRMPSSSNG
jgi:sulfoxide reductase heme-binding subunit YedZ